MNYHTPYCPWNNCDPSEPATDWESVDKLIAKFSIPRQHAIEYIENLGYQAACEDLGGEA